jgi:small-conductance mechanosensitive channel
MASMSRRFVRFEPFWIRIALIAAVVLLAWPVAAQQAATPDLAQLEAAKLELDRIEGALKLDIRSAQAVYDLGKSVNPVRDALRAKIAELEPRLAQADARLKQLGPAPGKDAPPENVQLAEERTRLNQEFGTLDAVVKQARLLLARSDQLAEQITERRRDLYARHLFEPSPSVASPSVWLAAGRAFGGEMASLGELLRSWWDLLRDRDARLRALWAALTLIALCAAMAVLWRRWRRGTAAGGVTTRFGKALASLGVLMRTALTAPLLTLAVVQVLELFALLPERVTDIGYGLAIAVAIAAFGRAVAVAVLAPAAPERRLVAIDDALARSLTRHFVWAARALAAAAVLLVLHRMLEAPPVLPVATNMLFALAIGALLLHLLWSSSRRNADEHAMARLLWLRAIGWLVLAAIIAALVLGYSKFAAFLSVRLISTVAIAGTLYLLLVLTHALFVERLGGSTTRGRALAANFGVGPRRLGLIATLVSGGICLVLILIALVLVIGPWEVTAGDLFDTLRNLAFGFRVGDFTVSFGAVFAAAAMLIAALVVTRLLQKWFERQLLPRTDIELSLQQSIAAIVGYIGVIVAIVLALSQLGIDLQKVALIAGALSVGIGFGLQSIVQNFVSGLILLAERPIRIGDWVVVKGEEGYVRRIRVRATEIETFERATVIVPNAEFISGPVKNWTHADTVGRIIVKVGVNYDSVPEKVQQALLDCAAAHPNVLKFPEPRALLLGFGENALEFELRAYVGQVTDGLVVRSDLHIAILKCFRETGIAFPSPQFVLRTRPEKSVG